MFGIKLLRQLNVRPAKVPYQMRLQNTFADGGKHATMNDLPVPTGDWVEDNARRNSKYNMTLISGLLAVIGAICTMKFSGLIYLNSDIPEYEYDEEEEQ